MKFLVDECLTPQLAEHLVASGHDTVHVRDINLLGTTDVEVMEAAIESERVGELLAKGGHALPSVILFRRHHDPAGQAAAIVGALQDLEESLIAGTVVVITEDRVRIRSLPIL